MNHRSDRIWMPATLVPVLLTLLLLAPAAIAQDNQCIGGDRVRDVSAWGRPATTFSPHPARDLGELKDLFDRYEADIRTVLQRAGWAGNADDLFLTVRGAREGDGTVTKGQVAPGAQFDWMAFRRQGKAACVRDIRWTGKQPFSAWTIKVISGDLEYTFMVPEDCMNLAAEKGTRPVPPPTCDLKASFDPDTDTVTLRGSTSGAGLEIKGVTTPGGRGNLADVRSSGPMTWSFSPQADGRYTFEAVATSASGRQSSTCSAVVEVARKKPVCSLGAEADPATGMIRLSAGGVGETRITGVTLWNGAAGDLAAVQSAGGGAWTFDPAATLPKKPGDYSYSFQAATTLHGFEATCSASALVVKAPRTADWIVRGYGARLDTAGDDIFRSTIRPDGTSERFDLSFANGTGFGLAVERMFNPSLGLEADLMLASFDAEFMFDLDDAWETDEQNVDFNSLTLGLNYHLTPGKRADLFIGGFLGLVQYNDVTFRALGETFRPDFDDDFGFGAKLGLDLPFGWESPWALTGSLRYMLTGATADNVNVDLDTDPLIGTLGLAYRF